MTIKIVGVSQANERRAVVIIDKGGVWAVVELHPGEDPHIMEIYLKDSFYSHDIEGIAAIYGKFDPYFWFLHKPVDAKGLTYREVMAALEGHSVLNIV